MNHYNKKNQMLQHVVHNKYCHCYECLDALTDISYFNAHKNHTSKYYDYLHFSNVQISTSSSQVVCPRNPGCERGVIHVQNLPISTNPHNSQCPVYLIIILHSTDSHRW